MGINVEITDGDIAAAYATRPISEIVSLISLIDECYGDWDLTKAIYKWAKNQKKVAKSEGIEF